MANGTKGLLEVVVRRRAGQISAWFNHLNRRVKACHDYCRN
jgi:hypothetical protein